MIPQLDGVNINSRQEWQHAIVPASQPRMEEGFPGVSQRFVRQGARQPDDLVIVGYLEGSGDDVAKAITALNTATMVLLAKKNDGLEHTVRVHNTLWSAMEIVEVGVLGPVEGLNTGTSSKKVRRLTRLSFRALREAVSEVTE